MANIIKEDLSDEEVFFGKMTLKEVKKHIWLNQGKNRTSTIVKEEPPVDCNASIHIIESHSQPNLRNPPSGGTPIITVEDYKSEENIVKMENMVPKPESPKKIELEEFNNTFEMVEYILNNGPVLDERKTVNGNSFNLQSNKKEIETLQTNILATLTPKKEVAAKKTPFSKSSPKNEINFNTLKSSMKNIKVEPKTPKMKASPVLTPVENAKNIKVKTESLKLPKNSPTPSNLDSPKYFTPSKSPRKQEDIFCTPSADMLKNKTPIFKTPGNPLSTKKSSAASLKYTPSKSPMYKHIQSPIASYIKGSVEVPMISNVCPKKPLPGSSMIPKLVKSSSASKIGNKENVNIPTTVFKSAKKTKVLQTPVVSKPQSQSQSAKKLLATLPRPPVILKHEGREFSKARKPLLNPQEDSIADLSSAQADVSLCTLVKPHKKL